MNEDPAKARWMVIQLVRWTGIGLFLVGLLASAGRIDLPDAVGYVLMVVGLVDAYFMPTLLARKWKSPK